MNYLSTNNAHKSGHTRSIAVNQSIGTFIHISSRSKHEKMSLHVSEDCLSPPYVFRNLSIFLLSLFPSIEGGLEYGFEEHDTTLLWVR